MHDFLGPLLEALGEFATTDVSGNEGPRWLRRLQWGCFAVLMLLLVAVLMLIFFRAG